MAFLMSASEMQGVRDLLVFQYDLTDQEFDDFVVHLRIKGDATFADTRLIHDDIIPVVLAREWETDPAHIASLDIGLLSFATGWPHELFDMARAGSEPAVMARIGELVVDKGHTQRVADAYTKFSYTYGLWFAPDDLRTQQVGKWYAFRLGQQE